jgi:hypothetical protein
MKEHWLFCAVADLDDHTKGWVYTILGSLGSVATWVSSHHAMLLSWAMGIASITAYVFAIRATRHAASASKEAARLSRIQADAELCRDCRDGIVPDICPHEECGRRPIFCPKNKKDIVI